MGSSDDQFSFLPPGGQTGALIRTLDWQNHPLGLPETWPPMLRATLSTILVSRHPMFLWWGPQLFQFYNDGYMPTFGVGKHPGAMGQEGRQCWPETWPIIGPQIEAVLSEGKASWHEDQLVPMYRNGKLEDVFWTYGHSPVFDESGAIKGVLVVCTETTKHVVEELRAAVIARDDFLTIVSHELKTPLTVLKLQTQLGARLLEKVGAANYPSDRLEKLITTLQRQTTQLSSLVESMFDVSRINAGKMVLSLAETDLSKLVEDTVERLAPHLEAAGCALVVNTSPQVRARLDAARIEQVIDNIVTNAIKYAPRGCLTVTVGRRGPVAKVSIRDEGEGIIRENLERIFNRFERATCRNEVSGLGLGLYICKEIIAEHGGKLYAESTVGKGAVFTFELPAQ